MRGRLATCARSHCHIRVVFEDDILVLIKIEKRYWRKGCWDTTWWRNFRLQSNGFDDALDCCMVRWTQPLQGKANQNDNNRLYSNSRLITKIYYYVIECSNVYSLFVAHFPPINGIPEHHNFHHLYHHRQQQRHNRNNNNNNNIKNNTNTHNSNNSNENNNSRPNYETIQRQ